MPPTPVPFADRRPALPRACRTAERTQKVTQSLGVPRAYVRLLVELEDFLNKTLAGAFSSFRQ